MKSNYLKIGCNTVELVEETLKLNNIEGKILYVAEPIVDGIYGSVVREQIQKVGILKTELVKHNTISYAMSIAERIIATDVSCIVGMGGGKVLDVCKYASYISKTPYLAIPTTVANDGIASPIAVLNRQDNKPKSLGCTMASMMLVDTNIILSSPEILIKAGVGDTISNYMALLDWEYAALSGKDEINGYAYLMSKSSIDALLKTQYQQICPDFIKVLINSLILSGIAMDFAGSSRPVSGSEHLFSHALDYYSTKKNLHGLQVALVGHDCDDVVDYLKKFEVDVNPRTLEIDEETFVYCMQNARQMRTNRYTYLNDADLSTERLKSIYKELVELL